MFRDRPRRGFTLAEVLVTIAIIAIIAAAIIPAVTSQISKGDETTVTAAVNTMRTSLTTFVADVRTFPSRISQFTTIPTALTDSSLGGSAYSAAQVGRWKGPYSTTSTFAADDSLPIGLNAFLGELVAAHPHPIRGGKQPRILFATQADTRPPRFVLFTSGFLDFCSKMWIRCG